MSNNTKWLLYNTIVAFSLYWASNLLLWFPWSFSPALGIALMLTVSPILWGYGVFNCLIRYDKSRVVTGAILNSIIVVCIAIVSDYIFFGLIRGAIKELYHPTTLYGYGFLVCIPYMEIVFFKKMILRKKREVNLNDLTRVLGFGLICLLILTLIIKLGIKI